MGQVKAGTRGEVQWSFGADPGANGAGNGLELPKLAGSKTNLRFAKKIADGAPNIRFQDGNFCLRISTDSRYLLNVVSASEAPLSGISLFQEPLPGPSLSVWELRNHKGGQYSAAHNSTTSAPIDILMGYF